MLKKREPRQFTLPGINDRVPCVFGEWFTWTRWWPVLPSPLHHDIEHLNFTAWHFHVDGRYLTDAQNKRVIGLEVAPENCHPMYMRPLTVFLRPKTRGHSTEHTAPGFGSATAYCQTRLLPQRRQMPPTPDYCRYSGAFQDLFDAYPNPVAVGGRCPHKGADLTGLPCNADGTVTCPLHGLRVRGVESTA